MEDIRIAIIGLGYVGLPLAHLFARKYAVTGFDINKERVAAVMSANDSTCELERSALQEVLVVANEPLHTSGLFCTTNIEDIASCNYYIVTVPTPVDEHNSPDLTPLYHASEIIGRVLGKGDVVIYESTVCPGITEEECVPILEMVSGLQFNTDFFVGYSPERINPGDKTRTVDKILKITSGSTPETTGKVDSLYRSVITAGTYPVSSIRVAEAAKVIENTQRDINIAFMNEIAKIFNRLDIDTNEVLEAAATKWNFLPFKPGLVGGHCIGVDPYYLIRKAQDNGYHPGLILAGRRINDTMGDYIAGQVIRQMIKKEIQVKGAEVLVLGFTFKENCPDIRNTRVGDMIESLEEVGVHTTVYDPFANPADVYAEYEIQISGRLAVRRYDAIILAVAHDQFLSLDLFALKKEQCVVYDVKGFLPREEVDARL